MEALSCPIHKHKRYVFFLSAQQLANPQASQLGLRRLRIPQTILQAWRVM